MAARRLTQKARGRLLWLLAGFALSQAVLAVAVDGWLEGVRDPEYAAKLQRLQARMRESPGRPLVLALGSSRTAFGLDARGLSERPGGQALVFNFAQMGGGPLLHQVVLRRLLDRGIRPDLLYVEVVPNMMAARGRRLMEERRLDAARLCAGEVWRLRPYYSQPYRLLGGWALARLLPCYRHQAELRGLLTGEETAGPAVAGLDSHGWHARRDLPDAEYRRQTAALVRGQNAEFCACPALAAEPVAALESLLSVCRGEGIPVALVLMPEGDSFRALYTAQARAALDGLLRRLERDWGVRVVDARTWVDEAGFWDSHHLLAGGARRFTERFGREALDPVMAALPPRSPQASR
jgi:hypothetical protein